MGDISNTIIDMINTKLTVTNKKQLQIVFFRLYAGSHDCFEVDYWFCTTQLVSFDIWLFIDCFQLVIVTTKDQLRPSVTEDQGSVSVC